LQNPNIKRKKQELERACSLTPKLQARHPLLSGDVTSNQKVAYAVTAAIPIVAMAFYLAGKSQALNPATAPSTPARAGKSIR